MFYYILLLLSLHLCNDSFLLFLTALSSECLVKKGKEGGDSKGKEYWNATCWSGRIDSQPQQEFLCWCQ